MGFDAQFLQQIAMIGIAVIGWFLRKKDEQQEKELESLRSALQNQTDLLWQKHDQDAKDLSELRLHIASQHYVKTELDARFDKMELTFTNGFNDLGNKLDRLTETMVSHINKGQC